MNSNPLVFTFNSSLVFAISLIDLAIFNLLKWCYSMR